MKKLAPLFLLLLLLLLLAPLPARSADISQTAASVLPSSQAQRSQAAIAAGVTITAGNVVTLDASSNLILADANAAAPANTVQGIAENGGSAGQMVTYITRDPALAIGGTVTSGAVVVLSATAGKLAPVADAATGWTVIVLGVGTGSNKINFAPLTGGAVP